MDIFGFQDCTLWPTFSVSQNIIAFFLQQSPPSCSYITYSLDWADFCFHNDIAKKKLLKHASRPIDSFFWFWCHKIPNRVVIQQTEDASNRRTNERKHLNYSAKSFKNPDHVFGARHCADIKKNQRIIYERWFLRNSIQREIGFGGGENAREVNQFAHNELQHSRIYMRGSRACRKD